MSATDELRRLLDERGVEWTNPVQMENSVFTRWHDGNNTQWTASEITHGNCKLRIGASSITPEQAIAATLGANDRNEPKSDVRAADVDANDANATLGGGKLTAEQERIAELEALVRAHEQGMRTAWVEYEKRDELIRDMVCELRSLNDGGISTDCMEHERRMRDLGIEVDGWE